MTQHSSKWLQMPIKEVGRQRDYFQLAPNATGSTEELPLLEKQALVDEILRGMPIKHIEYYEKRTGHNGKVVYLVTRGWPQLRAIFDFLDDKFATWTNEEREQWQH